MSTLSLNNFVIDVNPLDQRLCQTGSVQLFLSLRPTFLAPRATGVCFNPAGPIPEFVTAFGILRPKTMA